MKWIIKLCFIDVLLPQTIHAEDTPASLFFMLVLEALAVLPKFLIRLRARSKTNVRTSNSPLTFVVQCLLCLCDVSGNIFSIKATRDAKSTSLACALYSRHRGAFGTSVFLRR